MTIKIFPFCPCSSPENRSRVSAPEFLVPNGYVVSVQSQPPIALPWGAIFFGSSAPQKVKACTSAVVTLLGSDLLGLVMRGKRSKEKIK